jgi:hypothetical protein
MVANASIEAWSPAQAQNDDEPAPSEPVEITNLREACAHLAGVHGATLYSIHDVSDEVLAWLKQHGQFGHFFTSGGRELASFRACFVGVHFTFVVDVSRVA